MFLYDRSDFEKSSISDNENGVTEELEEITSNFMKLNEKIGNGENISAENSQHNKVSCFVAHLHDSKATHALTSDLHCLEGYSKGTFYGIMIDSGCAKGSTAGMDQYMAYCKHMGIKPKIDMNRKANVTFGKGSPTLFGNSFVKFPFNNFMLSSIFHFVNMDLPILLGLQDMFRLGFFKWKYHGKTCPRKQ